LIAISPAELRNSTEPSFGESITWAAAMAPFAPGLFSTMTWVFNSTSSCLARTLASESAGPPGGNATTKRIDFSG